MSSSSLRNRTWNCTNPYQGNHKKVLCVCSAGLLRSPTAAVVLASEPFGYNTRAAGAVKDYALIGVDEVLIQWADEIVCMETEHHERLMKDFPEEMRGKKVFVLEIPDRFSYRDDGLMWLIKEKYIEFSDYGRGVDIGPVQDSGSP